MSAPAGPYAVRVIGRGAELAAIDDFLSSGHGGVLLIEGPGGIGKTTLWRAAVAAAGDRSWRVLAACGSEAESRLVYAGLADLLSPLGDDALDGLPPVQSTALRTALDGAGPVEAGPVAAATLAVLQRLGRAAPVLVAVDDFQHLDVPSRRALCFALRRLADEPVALVVTERPPARIGTLLGVSATRIEVGPLSLAALHHLARDRLGIALERPTLVQVARASGGNPFFALEIVRALGDARLDPGVAPTVPGNLRALVGRRLGSAPAGAREAVLATYALARPTPELVETAVCAAGHDADGLAAAAEAELIELGSTVALAHPLYGSVLYGRLHPSARRALHARLAQLPLEAEEHAAHRALAADAPDEEVAALAEQAAARAVARGAPEAAAALLQWSLRLSDCDEPARARRLDGAAFAHFLAGDGARAAELWLELAETAPDAGTRARSYWRLAEFGFSSVPNGFERVPEWLDAAAALAPDDLELQASVEAVRADFLLWRGRPTAAAARAQLALAASEHVPNPEVRSRALVAAAVTRFFLGHGIDHELLAEAIELEPHAPESNIELLPSSFRSYLLAWSGDALEEAAGTLAEKLALALEGGDEASVPFLCFQLCEVAVAQGRLAEAEAYALRCREAVEQSGRIGRRSLADHCSALVDVHRGRLDDARTAARRALDTAEARRELVEAVRCRSVLALVELSEGRHDAALAWLEPAARQLAAGGHGEPALSPFVADQVEALLALGRVHEADLTLRAYERAAERVGRRSAAASAARCRGLVLAARGDTDGAVAALERSLALDRELGRALEEGRTLLALATVARRSRRKAVALRALREAHDLFERIGADLWRDRAAAEIGRNGRATAPEGLSETERQVAARVAAGDSNPQIAARLLMSRKTVEAHLSRIYRKLGIGSRAELAAWVASGRDA